MSILKINNGTPKEVTARDLAIGSVFRTADYNGSDAYLKVMPPLFFKNSSIFREKFFTGKYIFVLQIGIGTVTLMLSSTKVVVAKDASISYDF